MGQAVVHFEIGTRHCARAAQFYSSLFGWQVSDGGHATLIDTGSAQGIAGNIAPAGEAPDHYVTIYVQVDDIAASLRAAEALGARLLVLATDVGGVGHYGWFADPDGNVIGLWTPAAH
jgi:predicted enzyme related to lactoylglutathione lyase